MALSSGPCKCKLVGQQHPTFLGPTCCVPLNTLSYACCWKLLEVVPWGLRYSRLNFKQTSLNCIFLFHNNSSENTFITTVTNIICCEATSQGFINCLQSSCESCDSRASRLHTCMVLTFEWFVLGRYYGFIFEQQLSLVVMLEFVDIYWPKILV